MSYLITQYHWTTIFYTAAALGIVLLIAFIVAVYFNQKIPTEIKKPEGTTTSFLKLKAIILSKHFILLGSIGALLFLSLDIFAELWGPQFLRVTRHISIKHATWISGLIFWGWAIGSPLQAFIYKLLKSVRRCFLIESLLAAICISLAMIFIHSDLLLLEALLFLFGFFCSVEVLCFSVAVQWVHTTSAATAVAVINFFIMLSGMIFQPFVSELLNLGWGEHIMHHATRVYTSADFFFALAIIPIATFFAFFLSFVLPKNESEVDKVT
jgi:MFS family permease